MREWLSDREKRVSCSSHALFSALKLCGIILWGKRDSRRKLGNFLPLASATYFLYLLLNKFWTPQCGIVVAVFALQLSKNFVSALYLVQE